MLSIENILVVCVGNICRSPTAELLLREKLGERVKVHSAGLGALVGAEMDAKAAERVEAVGIDTEGHRARQLTAEMLRDADLVFVMEKGHINGVHNVLPTARGKVFLLGNWFDEEVPDPYRKSDEMFDLVFAQIDKCVSSWVAKIVA